LSGITDSASESKQDQKSSRAKPIKKQKRRLGVTRGGPRRGNAASKRE